MSVKEPEFSELAEALKREGNAYYKLEKFEEAYRAYTLAIKEQSQSPALFSNRSITNMKLGDYDEAFEDAKRATVVCTLSLRADSREASLPSTILLSILY